MSFQLHRKVIPSKLLAGDRADSRLGHARVAANMNDVTKLMLASWPKVLEAVQVLWDKYLRRPVMLDELKVIR